MNRDTLLLQVYHQQRYQQLVLKGHLAQRFNQVPIESVVEARGTWKGMTGQSHGRSELLVQEFKVLNEARNLPYQIHQNVQSEQLAKFRHLALRRPDLAQRLKERSKITHKIRTLLVEAGLDDIATPILVQPSTEGAKEFLVRSDRGTYALAQSPQQMKQLLICSGLTDGYFQFARCFRDEDGRRDRQLEFEQLDLELAWPDDRVKSENWGMSAGNVKTLVEKIICEAFGKCEFHVMTYEHAMLKFGSDKPDLRFGLEIQESGGELFIEVDEHAHVMNDPGVKVTKLGNKIRYSQKRPERFSGGSTALGDLRLQLQKVLNIPLQPCPFLWVIQFPLFTQTQDIISSTHHPFSAPLEQDRHLLETDPLAVRAQHYDLVFQGTEIGGGSVRIHEPELQKQIFNILKLDQSQKAAFEHLITALEHGAPPHAGFALGMDRVFAIKFGRESIRDVIAFPKTVDGADLTLKCPV